MAACWALEPAPLSVPFSFGSALAALLVPELLGWHNLVAGQSASLTLSPARAAFTRTQVTTTPVHVGDICNLGIFCVAPTSNRNLLDFNMETIDPKTGCAHIAFADDNTVNMLRVANQTAGCIRPS